jgi:hypothetical protein
MLDSIVAHLRSKSNTETRVRAAVECVGSHWVILVQNPGQKGWVAVRSTTVFCPVYNKLRQEIAREPALETFAQKKLAVQWLSENLSDHVLVTRDNRSIEDFRQQALAPVTIKS